MPNTKKPMDVLVIGAGNCFQKYVKGNQALKQGGEEHLSFKHVVDIKPELQLDIGEPFMYHQLINTKPEGLVELLEFVEENEEGKLPVLILTPPKFHTRYALILAQGGRKIGLEKPFAPDKEGLAIFDFCFSRNQDDLFLFEYYLLEKGLPLIALSSYDSLKQAVLDDLIFGADADTEIFYNALDLIAPIRKLEAVLLEGKEKAGVLEHRDWMLFDENGGITLDIMYHLVTLAKLFESELGKMELSSVSLGAHRQTSDAYAQNGMQIAETLTQARMKSSKDVQIYLIAGKYVDEEAHQRFLNIIGENGYVNMDLETNVLTLQIGQETHEIQAKIPEKMAPQLKYFIKRMQGDFPLPYELYVDALRTSLDMREKGLAQGIQSYEREQINNSYLEQFLGKE